MHSSAAVAVAGQLVGVEAPPPTYAYHASLLADAGEMDATLAVIRVNNVTPRPAATGRFSRVAAGRRIVGQYLALVSTKGPDRPLGPGWRRLLPRPTADL